MTAGLMAAASYAAAQGVITGVDVVRTDSGLEVMVQGENLAMPSVTRANRGSVYIAAFRGVLRARPGRENVNAFGVSSVQWVQFTARPPVSRVVLRLRPTDQPTITKVDGGFRITVGNNPAPTAAPANTTRTTVLPLPTPNQVESESSASDAPRVLSGTATRPMNPIIAEVIPALNGKLVTLEFDDADVSQVLKALAIQANVNVVTSPEVTGKLTIKLERVTVEHAMNVITALAGLRYQQVDQTLVVAPPDKMVDILRGINARDPELSGATETRIIPIFSRQGRQLKAAAYRMVAQTNRAGRYEIVLPSEQVEANPIAAAVGASSSSSATQAGAAVPPSSAPAAGGGAAAGNNAPRPDEYVMIIGQRARIEEVERVLRDLDAQLCAALGIEIPSSTATIQQTYLVRGATAAALLNAIGATAGRVGEVTVNATPESSNSPQAIVLTGREHDVRRLMNALSELDSTGSTSDEFKIYDIAFSEPRSLRDEIVAQVPGIRASIAPAAVGNPRLYTSRGSSVQVGGTASTNLAQQAQAGGGAGGGQSSNATEGAVGGQDGFQGGLGQPFSSVEPIAQPMRLILRGNKEQIERAREILAKLDVAPKMVALEVRVMELTRDDALNIGLDWNIFTGGAVKFIRLRNTTQNPSNSVGVGIDDRNFTGDVVTTLDRVANRNNLLARPNMIAPDGRESELFIGDAIRYVETITASQNGPSVQIGTVRVGINLAVLPRVSGDGTMTLDLRPVVSFLRGFNRVNVQGFAAELPQTSERITQQTITLRSGETFAISGLIQTEDVKQMSGVPILMDLPIIGALFRRTTNTTVRRELVIFVTARALTGPLSSETAQLPMQPDLRNHENNKNKDKSKPDDNSGTTNQSETGTAQP